MAIKTITGYKVVLEDNGQDFLEFITDPIGNIVETNPFQAEIWNGGYIPVETQVVGEDCMMHKPPEFIYGFLKHKVTEIIEITE